MADGEPEPADGVDPRLRMLVRAVNAYLGEDGLPLGLNVQGLTVFGKLVSHASWLATFASYLEPDPVDDEHEVSIRQMFAQGEAVYQAELAIGIAAPPRFIHLAAVTILAANGTVQVPSWRCRIEAVDAWFLGEPA